MTRCSEHAPPSPSDWSDDAVIDAARIFRALGDPARLRTLEILARGEQCVSTLADVSSEGLSTVSQRLRLLKAEGLVTGRREGRHIYYSLRDQHVADLVLTALTHATETHP